METEIVKTEEIVTEEKVVDSPEIIERATLQGWIPPEKFKGDKKGFVSAKDYVERADHMMPIMKAQNIKYERQILGLQQDLSVTKETMNKMVTVQQKYSNDTYDSQVADIETQKRQAADDGDLPLYDSLDKKQKKLAKPETIEVEQPGKVESQRWIQDNSWFNEDNELTEYAVYLGNKMIESKHHLATPGNEYAFGEEVKKQLKKTFPSKFENPNNKTSDFDETDTRGGEEQLSGDKKSWNDLPADAKAHCNTMLANGEIPGYTKERYIKDYFEA